MRVITVLALVIYGSQFCIQSFQGSLQYSQKEKEQAEGTDKVVNEVIAQQKNCEVVYYFRSSNIPFALSFASFYVNKRYASVLQAKFPNFMHYDVNYKTLDNWEKVLSPEETKAFLSKPCVIFSGTSKNWDDTYRGLLKHFDFKEIYEGKDIGVYRYRGEERLK